MAFESLQERIGYRFNDAELLTQALTHKSYAHENKTDHNERLEFLGDAVLQLVISDYLTLHYPKMSEGQLSKFRSVLVNEAGLEIIANKLCLGEALFIGKGEEQSGGRQRASILANAMEALFAAIYLDSKQGHGVGLIAKIITDLFASEIEANEVGFEKEDYKTRLQEWAQSRKLGDIQYQVVLEEGPDHDKTFTVTVIINGKNQGQGVGKSKKLAEQQAAYNALKGTKQP